MERRVAERLAAKAARSELPPWKTQDIEKAPDSGVRASEPNLAAAHGLSFAVYSVDDLDARQRVSAPPPVSVEIPSRWPHVWSSFKALTHAWWGCLGAQKPRPRMMDVCGVPLMTLRTDLVEALKTLPWKKIAIRGGIALVSTLFLLFVVMAVADLTDDVKPSRGTITNKLEAPKRVAPVVEAPPAEPAPAIEIDDVPVPAKKAVVKKSSAKKKKKGGTEPFIP